MCGGSSGPVPLQQRPDDQLMAIRNPVHPTERPTFSGKPVRAPIFAQKAATPAGPVFGTRQTNKYNEDLAAYNKAQAELQRRQVIKDQQAAIAAERQAAVEEQQRQMEELQRQQQAETVRQGEQSAQFERDRAAQQLQIAGTRAASQSVAQSLQILSKQNGQQAPTAVIAKRKGPQAGPRNTAAALRMGSTSSSAGSGPNIAV